MDEENYRRHFRALTSFSPHDYQLRVARRLFEGRNLLLRAPTGAGKTLAVLAPFFAEGWKAKPCRLIYALPLRTLAQGIYREAESLALKLGRSVTLQTGDQPDDPFFDRGDVIITTYDQILSGLLCAPYGLSARLHNVNAATIAGALVILDEFHLMAPDQAFLTAVAGTHLFKDLCQSVWMTATATAPLQNMLRSVLDVITVPEDPTIERALLDSLPAVTSVTRTLVCECEPLTAQSILNNFNGRSIALVNTVDRAQLLFDALREKLGVGSAIQLILLHSRFFQADRRQKETLVNSLFGPKATGEQAILVATQVIEAGLDISCDQLHTELCPMNSLVQRAGRCARFPGQRGTVHVHPLPAVSRAWLPYGNLDGEATVLARTRELLSGVRSLRLDPVLLEEWIQQVHAKDDEQAVRPGLQSRTEDVLDLVFQIAVRRNSAGVAHLIRGDDNESIRALISAEEDLPQTPGQRESISLPRWSLAPHLNCADARGWYWDGTDDSPWKPLTSSSQLAATYAVCLDPRVARYDADCGLRLGLPGKIVSPRRVEPKRPGYAPLREESWLNHARMVASEAERRVARQGGPGTLLAAGLTRRYGLSPNHLRVAARASGALHDLGKLQMPWQEWAKAIQSSKDPSYRMTVPLAHTDFDPDNPSDRQRERSLPKRRPPHAVASAYWSLSVLEDLYSGLPENMRFHIVSASLAAIVSHHGGFLPGDSGLDLGIFPFIAGWKVMLEQSTGCRPHEKNVTELAKYSDKKGLLSQCLDATTGRAKLARWWPLVAYLMRIVRLSDQRATSEWTCG